MDCFRSPIQRVITLGLILPFAFALSHVASVEAAAAAAAAKARSDENPGSGEKPETPKSGADEKKAPVPLGRYITLSSPVDDVVFGRVKNAALTLQNQAQTQQRRAVLVLEITPGSSPFHQVYGLAKFLSSIEIRDVTTVAWIPEAVNGNNVILALACDEIVMHPDAELGDIGLGKALDRDEQQDVLRLVEKRRNPRLSVALALGMMDPQRETLRAKIQINSGGKETTEFRVVTKDELERLRQTKAAILDVQTLKEAGELGTYSGAKARGLGILAVQAVHSRGELAEIYNLPREALREDPTSGEKPHVQLIKIDGMIDSVMEAFIERQIDRAVSDGVNTLIFHIDSPGGYVTSSENLARAIAELDPKKVRSIAFIPNKALSGAAIIALGCDEIYMNSGARLGDAEPIEITTGQQYEHVPE